MNLLFFVSDEGYFHVFRDDFRKAFKEANPDCKKVSTVLMNYSLILIDCSCDSCFLRVHFLCYFFRLPKRVVRNGSP